jgi:CheY-like chemotaxis protein
MNVIQRASERGRGLVRGLTQFARKEIQETRPLALNQLVRDEVALLRRTLLQKVELEEDLEEPLPQVLGESSALGSVLMNICVNAVDAMPQGGRITIRTRALAGGWVELSVADTGEGMTAEVQAKAFEPFYTTKAVGKGTGLGLSMAYAAAKAHGGSLELRSAPGQGTTVSLRLPALLEPQAASASGRAQPGTRPLLVLVVDDDELVRDAVPPMLASLGHRVELAGGGREGLTLLAGGLEPDLILLDLNMPELGGAATLRQLRSTRPHLPVLIVTGFMDAATEAELRLDPSAGWLRKPFLRDDLAQAIHRLGF